MINKNNKFSGKYQYLENYLFNIAENVKYQIKNKAICLGGRIKVVHYLITDTNLFICQLNADYLSKDTEHYTFTYNALKYTLRLNKPKKTGLIKCFDI